MKAVFCDVCKKSADYCPNCGADMRGNKSE